MQDRRTVPPAAPTGLVACLGEALALVDPVTGVDAGGAPVPRRAALAGAEANVAVALAAAGVPASGSVGWARTGWAATSRPSWAARGALWMASRSIRACPPGGTARSSGAVAGGEPSDRDALPQSRFRRGGDGPGVPGPNRRPRRCWRRRRWCTPAASRRHCHRPARRLMRALLTGRRRGGLVSFDVNWREQLWPDGDPAAVVALAGAADVVWSAPTRRAGCSARTIRAELRALLPSPRLAGDQGRPRAGARRRPRRLGRGCAGAVCRGRRVSRGRRRVRRRVCCSE